MPTRFSEFVDGNDLLQTDIVVGLRGGNNTFFDIPFDPSDVASATTLATVVSDLNNVEAVTFLVQVADAAVPNAQAMGALATGIVKNTTTTGVQVIAVNTVDYWAPGDQMTIPASPTLANEVADKQYVDSVAGSGTLAGLTDVTLTAPADGQALVYNGTVWVNLTDLSLNTLDAFTRRQINFIGTDSVLRLGQSQADGDGASISTEGAVFYGPATNATFDAQNVGFARIKHNRFALTNQINGLGNVDLWRVDTTSQRMRDTAGTLVYTVDYTGHIANTSINLSASTTVSSILDEDNMASDSDTALATQQSIKAYVDNTAAAFAAGFSYLFPVRVASVADFNSTYDNGTAGVGATLTAVANGAASIDGVALSVNDLVLFKDQTNTFENGLYRLTTNGDGSNPSIFTRSTTYDLNTEIQFGDMFNIVEGTVNARNNWTLDVVVATIGTDPLTFVQNYSQLVNDAAPFLGGNLNVSTFTITSADGTDLIDINDGSIDIQTASTSRMDITDAGVRLGGANARVTTVIDDDTMATATDTNIATSESIVAYIDSSSEGNTNSLINGSFDIWQRGFTFTAATTPANNDDTYLTDAWDLLSDGNDIVDVSREATGSSGFQAFHCSMDVQTANTKFGYIQFLSNDETKKLLNDSGTSPVVFSLDIMVDAGLDLDDCRMAILAWTGTADSITSDVVATWEAGGTNPTLAANWAYVNTPTNLNVVNAWDRFEVTGDAGLLGTTNNLAVMVFNNDTTVAAASVLSIGRAKFEIGSSATKPSPTNKSEEYLKCQRYYYQSYAEGVNAGTSTVLGSPVTTAGAVNLAQGLLFQVPMRAAPTIVIYATDGSTAQVTEFVTNGTVGTVITANNISEKGFLNLVDSGTGLVAGDMYRWNITASSEL